MTDETNAPETTTEPKKSVINKTTIVGALATILIGLASCPGLFAWLDSAGERASKASQQAQESEEKANLAYQLLKQKIEFQAKEFDSLQQDVREIRSGLSTMRSAAVTHMFAGSAQRETEEIQAAYDKSEASAPAEPEQPDLPESLEKAWKAVQQ